MAQSKYSNHHSDFLIIKQIVDDTHTIQGVTCEIQMGWIIWFFKLDKQKVTADHHQKFVTSPSEISGLISWGHQKPQPGSPQSARLFHSPLAQP